MEIQHEIISRGTMRIQFGDKVALIPGELTFDPPVFYAELNSVQYWEDPLGDKVITDDERQSIINYFVQINTAENQTKIIIEP